MLSVTVVTLFALVAQAPAQKVWPSVPSVRIPQKFSVLPLNRAAPMNFRVSQGRPDLGSPWNPWMRNWNQRVSATEGEQAPPAPETATAATAKTGGLNVYGQQLQGCENEGDLCSYTESSPMLCIRTGKTDMRFGCKSIWNADWKPLPSAERWKYGDAPVEQKPVPGDTTKCDGVPAEVLDSQYSKDEFNRVITVNEPKGLFSSAKDKKTTMPSEKAERFRASIDFICQTCAVNTDSDSNKKALEDKCKAMGWKPPELLAQAFPSIVSFPALVLIGVFVGSGVAFMLFNFRRSTADTIKMSLI